MQRSIRKKFDSNKGITLVALVVSLIVLLILAALSLSGIFSEKGILKKPENASAKYNEAKAREALETVLLADAQAEKRSNSKYNKDDFLDNLIKSEIEGADVKGDVAIVGEYAYELDRSVPKIENYLGRIEDIIFPHITIGAVELINDYKNAKFTITATILEEAEKGINRLEIWLAGEKLDEFTYNNEKTITKVYDKASRNGVYTVKAYADLMGSARTIVEGIVPSVEFTPNGNTTWKKEHSTKVTVRETIDKVKSMKYKWTTSVVAPAESEFTETFTNNSMITGKNDDMTGTYYLWILLETNTGKKNICGSEAFYFDNKGPNVTVRAESVSVGCLNLNAVAIDDGVGEVNLLTAIVNDKPVNMISEGNGSFSVQVDNIRFRDVPCVVTFVDSLGNTTVSEGLATCKMVTWEFYNAVEEKNVSRTTSRTYHSDTSSQSGYNSVNWESGTIRFSGTTSYSTSDIRQSAPSLFKSVDATHYEFWRGAGVVKELEHNGYKYNYYYHNGWNVTVYHVTTNISFKKGTTLKDVFYGIDENEFTEGCTDGNTWINKVIQTESLISEW